MAKINNKRDINSQINIGKNEGNINITNNYHNERKDEIMAILLDCYPLINRNAQDNAIEELAKNNKASIAFLLHGYSDHAIDDYIKRLESYSLNKILKQTSPEQSPKPKSILVSFPPKDRQLKYDIFSQEITESIHKQHGNNTDNQSIINKICNSHNGHVLFWSSIQHDHLIHNAEFALSNFFQFWKRESESYSGHFKFAVALLIRYPRRKNILHHIINIDHCRKFKKIADRIKSNFHENSRICYLPLPDLEEIQESHFREWMHIPLTHSRLKPLEVVSDDLLEFFEKNKKTPLRNLKKTIEQALERKNYFYHG